MEANTERATDVPDCETCTYKIEATQPVITAQTAARKKIADPWKHRSEGMRCETCMWHVNTRCRRHAPTMQGYPAVFPDDWCGDHKLDKVSMGGV